MKTQQINWFYIMVFFCIFSIMLLGCDRTNSGVGDETFYSKLYEDSTYLAFDGNIFDVFRYGFFGHRVGCGLRDYIPEGGWRDRVVLSGSGDV